MTWISVFKMTFGGAVGALFVDFKEFYYWRKRNDGTKYDYLLALSRLGMGIFGGLMADLGLSAGAALTGL